MMDDLRLDGKIALVTGASRGIGKAVAERLARAGADVTLTWTSNEAQAAKTAEDLRAEGFVASAVQLDVRDPEQVNAVIDGLAQDRGALHVLVNNAGITRDTLLLTMSEEDWLEVINTNLSGMARCTRAVVRPMMLSRGGSIINLSSVSAARPNRGQSNYAASKGGVEAFTRAIACELGRKRIRVNAVAPGVIETDMSARVREEAGKEIKKRIVLRSFGTPEQVASVVHFLASEASSYMTGQVLTVDGGMSLG